MRYCIFLPLGLSAMLFMATPSYAYDLCDTVKTPDTREFKNKLLEIDWDGSPVSADIAIAKTNEILAEAKTDTDKALVLFSKAKLLGRLDIDASLEVYNQILKLKRGPYWLRTKAYTTIISNERPRNSASAIVKPINRQTAIISKRAFKQGLSGKCWFVFDVDEAGNTANIDVFDCTSQLHKRNTRKAVQKWTYEIPKVDGKPMRATGLISIMNFGIRDETGRNCPYPYSKG